MEDWDEWFMGLADYASTRSKDPSTKVGCAVVRPDRTVASLGYNGFPRGIRDSPERYANRETKYAMVVHAEANAILNAFEPLRGMTMYCTLHPCSACALLIIQAGIKRVVFRSPSQDQEDRWGENMERARSLLSEAGVRLSELYA